MDVRTKLTLLLAFNIFVLAADNTEVLLSSTVLAIAAFLISRPDKRFVKTAILITVPVVWSLVIMQGLFYSEFPRTVVAVIVPPSTPVLGQLTGGVFLYYQGLIYGLKQSLRAVAITLAGLAVARTLSEAEIVRLVSFLDSRIAAGIASALRSFPTLIDDWSTISTVKRLHHLRISSFRALIPLVAATVRRSYTTSLALLTSGVSPGRRRIYKPWRREEMIVSMAVISASLTFALLKLLTYLFLLNLLYIPELKHLYWFIISNNL